MVEEVRAVVMVAETEVVETVAVTEEAVGQEEEETMEVE